MLCLRQRLLRHVTPTEAAVPAGPAAIIRLKSKQVLSGEVKGPGSDKRNGPDRLTLNSGNYIYEQEYINQKTVRFDYRWGKGGILNS